MERKSFIQSLQSSSFLCGILLMLECTIWGFSNAFAKKGLNEITPLWALTLRYFIAAILFAAFFGRRIKQNFKTAHLKPCLIVSVWTAAGFILGFTSLNFTSATNSTFLINLAVVMVPLFSAVIFKTKLRPTSLLPVTMAAMGLFLICGGKLNSIGTGEFLAILCSFAMAFMILFSTRYLNGKDIDPFVLCLTQSLMCFAISLTLALCIEPLPDFSSIGATGWGMVGITSVGCTFIAYTCQNIALSKVSSTFGALAFCAEPVFTAFFAYFMVDERLSSIATIGAVLILISIVFSTLLENRKPKTPKQA